jgi:hypothetical protein
MKLSFAFGFNGGQFHAEVDNLDDADKVIQYALKRGIVTVTVQTETGPVEVDLTTNDAVVEAAKPAEEVTETGTDVPEKGTTKAKAKSPAKVSPADAAQAVKDYAAKHGVEKGRELLASFGLKRTNEIKDDNAAAILAAAKE